LLLVCFLRQQRASPPYKRISCTKGVDLGNNIGASISEWHDPYASIERWALLHAEQGAQKRKTS
jgi:hypothetical protein